MDHQDRLGAAGDPLFNAFGIHIVAVGIHIREYGNSILKQDSNYSTHIGDGGCDHLVPNGNAASAQRYVNSGSAGGGGNTVGHLVHFPELLRQGFDLIAVPVKEGILLQRFFQLRQFLLAESLSCCKRSGLDFFSAVKGDVLCHIICLH